MFPEARLLLALALLAPAALAHAPAGPRPECQDTPFDPSLGVHDYAAGGAAAQVVLVNGNVQDCGGGRLWDRDWEFGVGGAFLPREHHFGTAFMVLDDAVGSQAGWYAGVDRNGDGIVAPAASDPRDPDCLLGPFFGAADVAAHPEYQPLCYPPMGNVLVPGWWIFIPLAVPGGLPPTSGHVYTGWFS